MTKQQKENREVNWKDFRTHMWSLLTKKDKYVRDIVKVKDKTGKPIKGYRQKKKAFFKQEGTLKWNIYQPNTKWGEHNKKFYKTNFIIKQKFMYPMMWILTKILGKHMDTKIPKDKYNKNLQILDDAVEKTIHEWHRYFKTYNRQRPIKDTNPETIAQSKKQSENPRHTYRMMKNLFITLTLTDTALREFVNIMMHNIAQGMNEAYKNKRVAHLFYTSRGANDVDYLVLSNNIQTIYDQQLQRLLQRNVTEATKIGNNKTGPTVDHKAVWKERTDLENLYEELWYSFQTHINQKLAQHKKRTSNKGGTEK